MNLVNLAPHTLNIFSKDGERQLVAIEPSGDVARVSVSSTKVGETAEGVALFATTFGEIEGLPEPQKETIYIVSMLVRSAVPDRPDVASPGELIRNKEGRPLGCKGLNINSPSEAEGPNIKVLEFAMVNAIGNIADVLEDHASRLHLLLESVSSSE